MCSSTRFASAVRYYFGSVARKHPNEWYVFRGKRWIILGDIHGLPVIISFIEKIVGLSINEGKSLCVFLYYFIQSNLTVFLRTRFVSKAYKRTLMHFELVWRLFKNRNVHQNLDIDRIGSIEFDEIAYNLIERQNTNEEIYRSNLRDYYFHKFFFPFVFFLVRMYHIS